MTGYRLSRPVQLLIGIVVIGLILILIDNVFLPGHSRLAREINNAGHIPLFGILALVLLGVTRSIWAGSSTHPLACYAIAFAAAGVLGVVSELLQYIGPRDADVTDLLRDLLGAGSFLALFASYDGGRGNGARALSQKARVVLRYAGTLSLALGFFPVVLWSAAFYHRAAQMPVLCNFDSYLHTLFLERQHSTLEPASGAETGHSGAKLTFGAGRYPGFSIEDVYPDWTAYDSLVFDLFSPLDSVFILGLRIDDVHHNGDYEDRYTGSLRILPGANRIAVSLADVRDGPHYRQQDMQQMAALWIYGDSTAFGTRLWIQNIRLQ